MARPKLPEVDDKLRAMVEPLLSWVESAAGTRRRLGLPVKPPLVTTAATSALFTGPAVPLTWYISSESAFPPTVVCLACSTIRPRWACRPMTSAA